MCYPCPRSDLLPMSPVAQQSRAGEGSRSPRYSALTSRHQRRLIQCGEAVVTQPAQVGFEEGAQVGNAVLKHADPLQPHAEGEALPAAGIDAAVLQHPGTDHAAAEDLEP